jgi:hypothetical protein
MQVEESLRVEAPKVSAPKVRSLLVKAGFTKASYTGWVYANSGFKIGKLHVAKDEDKIMVEYMAQHVYGVMSREDSLRQAADRQAMLLRYRRVLSEAGLKVAPVEYSTGGNLAYLLVG